MEELFALALEQPTEERDDFPKQVKRYLEGGTTVEAFGGFPVARRFDYDTFSGLTAIPKVAITKWAVLSYAG